MNLDTVIRGHITAIQKLLREHFGNVKGESGEASVHIAPTRVSLTDEHCHIVARGPAKVATVIRRKRKGAK